MEFGTAAGGAQSAVIAALHRARARHHPYVHVRRVGIHFRQGDLESREMGKQIGRLAWQKALEYSNGLADKTSYRIDVARGREHFTAGDAEDTEDRWRSLVISNQSGH
jgi:hypothetical protein